jgi:Glycosyl hydrolase family 36 C-terminal domain
VTAPPRPRVPLSPGTPLGVRWRGLDVGARYHDRASAQRYWGATLLADGLALPEEMASTFGSTLIHLVRVGQEDESPAGEAGS